MDNIPGVENFLGTPQLKTFPNYKKKTNLKKNLVNVIQRWYPEKNLATTMAFKFPLSAARITLIIIASANIKALN